MTMNPTELKGALEAIIYAADEPATLEQIANAVGEEKQAVRAALDEMIASYAGEDRGIEIRAVAGGYKFYTKPQHHDVVRRFIKSLRPPLRLTMPALETLAVISYRQPVTGPEIQEIRGVNVSGVIKTLLEKRLITTAGRKAVMGRPILYRTSKEFLMRFGLSDLDELPSLKEFEQLARAALGSDEGIAPIEPETESLDAADAPDAGDTAPAAAAPSSEGSELPKPAPIESSPDWIRNGTEIGPHKGGKCFLDKFMLERLQKIIARAGIASRRHAEELIRSGQVRVNGVVVTELGVKADPEHDRIEAAGKVAQISKARVYVLLHKPPQIVSTLADPEGRRTLRNLLVGVSERVFPVGRLDYAASGVVFLTSDGELASRMLKASPHLQQTYWIKVKGRLSETQLKSLASALRGKIFPLRAPHSAGKNPPNPWYEVEFSGVRRDLLRRNLLAMGHRVEKMKRTKLASLEIETVAEGQYRRLDPREVAKLVRAIEYALENKRPSPHKPENHRVRRGRPK